MKKSLFLAIAAVFQLIAFGATTPKAAPAKALPVHIGVQNTVFSVFRLHHQGRGVTATWSMTSLADVAGFTVERTYEDATDPYAFWEQVGTVPCNAPRSFTYTDKDVFPGIISYRVVAWMNDGTTVVSDVAQIRIVSRK